MLVAILTTHLDSTVSEDYPDELMVLRRGSVNIHLRLSAVKNPRYIEMNKVTLKHQVLLYKFYVKLINWAPKHHVLTEGELDDIRAHVEHSSHKLLNDFPQKMGV